MYGITPVAAPRIVKVYDIEFRSDTVLLNILSLVPEHLVVGYDGEVGILVVIDIHRIGFGYLLAAVHHGIRLAGAGSAEDYRGTKRVHHIHPTLVPPFSVIELCGEVYRILVVQKLRFLLERFVLVVEAVVHHVVLQHSAHIHSSDKHKDVAYDGCEYVAQVPADTRHPPV